MRSYVDGGDGQEPHIFRLARAAYGQLVKTVQSQAICISGESGAGKTETMKLVLQYITNTSRSLTKNAAEDTEAESLSMEQRILQMNPLTEGFGNAKTTRNNNSSRFGKWTALHMTPVRFAPWLIDASQLTLPWMPGRWGS